MGRVIRGPAALAALGGSRGGLGAAAVAAELTGVRGAAAAYPAAGCGGRGRLGAAAVCAEFAGVAGLAALAEFYGVSLDYLFCRSEVPEPLGSFSPEERLLLERYREMDPRGRRLLSAMADLECDLESDRH